MTIRIVHYSFEGQLRVEAETDDEAQRKFEQQSAIDLAHFAADSLKMLYITEEGKEREGLSALKADDMMARAKW